MYCTNSLTHTPNFVVGTSPPSNKQTIHLSKAALQRLNTRAMPVTEELLLSTCTCEEKCQSACVNVGHVGVCMCGRIVAKNYLPCIRILLPWNHNKQVWISLKIQTIKKQNKTKRTSFPTNCQTEGIVRRDKGGADLYKFLPGQEYRQCCGGGRKG